MDRSPILIAPLLASVLWGGMYVVSKWTFPVVAPITLSFIRVCIGSIALIAIVWYTEPTKTIPRRDWLGFANLGLLVSITIVGQFVGTDFTNASQGSIFTMVTPVFTLFLGAHLLNEQITRRKISGVAIAIIGVSGIVASQYDIASIAAANFLGIGLFFFSSAAWAGFTVYGKPLIQRYSPLETAAYGSLTSVPMIGILLPVEWALYDQPFFAAAVTPPVILALLYLGLLSTALAWYLWYSSVEEVPTGIVSVYLFAQPAVGVTFGAIFLQESIDATFLLGAAIMGLGIYIVSTEPDRTTFELILGD